MPGDGPSFNLGELSADPDMSPSCEFLASKS